MLSEFVLLLKETQVSRDKYYNMVGEALTIGRKVAKREKDSKDIIGLVGIVVKTELDWFDEQYVETVQGKKEATLPERFRLLELLKSAFSDYIGSMLPQTLTKAISTEPSLLAKFFELV